MGLGPQALLEDSLLLPLYLAACLRAKPVFQEGNVGGVILVPLCVEEQLSVALNHNKQLKLCCLQIPSLLVYMFVIHNIYIHLRKLAHVHITF